MAFELHLEGCTFCGHELDDDQHHCSECGDCITPQHGGLCTNCSDDD